TSQDKATIVQDADIVVLSTKPYDVENAIKSIVPYLTEDQIVMSVIAGVSTVQITEMIGKEIPVIRVMPNTSASIVYSATAITQDELTSQKDQVISKKLFEAIGTFNIVEKEKMHVGTSISGSGPAYIY